MSKLFSSYNGILDKCWYKSSNIIYSECDDKDKELKTLRIVFKNGRTYEYYNVDVNDYVLFKSSPSQGNAFVKYIRKYDCKRLDDSDVSLIEQELNEIQNNRDN